MPILRRSFAPTFRVLALLALALAAPAAWAQIIVVNVYNPAAVTFTPTGANAAANSTGISTNFAVRFGGFFTTGQTNQDFPAITDTLFTTGGTHNLDIFMVRGAAGTSTLVLRTTGNTAQFFSTSSPAFTGAATIDFTSAATALPTAGTTGNIYDYTGTTVVGTYSVVSYSAVPEPGTYAALAGGAALLAAGVIRTRRRRQPAP